MEAAYLAWGALALGLMTGAGTDPGDGAPRVETGVEMALEPVAYHVETVRTRAIKHRYLTIMYH